MLKNAHRRWYGLGLGLAIGLAYGLFSQGINYLWMPGVSLYHALFGFWGNIALAALVGALLGLTTAWDSTSVWGVIWGSLLGAALMIAISLPGGDQQAWGIRILMLALIFLPVAGACALILILFRNLVDREMYAWADTPFWSRRRALWPFAALAAAAIIGSLAMYPALGRTVTVRMHALIQVGRAANRWEELPAPLQGKEVLGFMEQRQGAYRLAWESDPNNRFRIARPVTQPYHPSTVVAYFDSGWVLACVFPNAAAAPVCKSGEAVP